MDYCPKCGAELADDGLEGLCAMCLLAGGFETSAATAAEATTQADPVKPSNPTPSDPTKSCGY